MKLLEKINVLEAVGSDGSCNVEHGNQVMHIPGKITAWSNPGFIGSQWLEVEREEGSCLDMTYVRLSYILIFLINFPHLIFPDLWHKTETSSISPRTYLGQK